MKPSRRLSLALALVSLLPPLAVVASVGWLLQRNWAVERRQAEDRAVRTVQEYLEEIRQELRSSLDVLVQERQIENILVEMVRGTLEKKSLVHLARQWMEARGLDLLTLVDGEGKVISCGHMPARFGENEPVLARAAEGDREKVFLRREAVLEDGSIHEKLAVVALARRSFESASVALMAGMLLEGQWMSRLEKLVDATLAIADTEEELLLAGGGRQAGEEWSPSDARRPSEVQLPPPLDEELGEARLVIDVRQEELERHHLMVLASMAASALVGWLLAWWLGWIGLRSIVARAETQGEKKIRAKND